MCMCVVLKYYDTKSIIKQCKYIIAFLNCFIFYEYFSINEPKYDLEKIVFATYIVSSCLCENENMGNCVSILIYIQIQAHPCSSFNWLISLTTAWATFINLQSFENLELG